MPVIITCAPNFIVNKSKRVFDHCIRLKRRANQVTIAEIRGLKFSRNDYFDQRVLQFFKND